MSLLHVLQIRPFGFEGSWPDRYFKYWLPLDGKVFYFQISLGSRDFCTREPGDTGFTPMSPFHALKQSCFVPWPKVRAALISIGWVNRSSERYNALVWTQRTFVAYDSMVTG